MLHFGKGRLGGDLFQQLALFLPRTVNGPRVRRTIRTSADRMVHMMTLRGTGDVDGQLRRWLAEAYLAAGG